MRAERTAAARKRGEALVPYHSKYFAAAKGTEVPGWRSSSPSLDCGVRVTIQSPSRVPTRATLNSSPRYPHWKPPKATVSVPVLPRVGSKCVLRVPRSPRASQIELQTTAPATSQGLRLPAVRFSVDRGSLRHSHVADGKLPDLSACFKAQSLTSRSNPGPEATDSLSLTNLSGFTTERKQSEQFLPLHCGNLPTEGKSRAEVTEKPVRETQEKGKRRLGSKETPKEMRQNPAEPVVQSDRQDSTAGEQSHSFLKRLKNPHRTESGQSPDSSPKHSKSKVRIKPFPPFMKKPRVGAESAIPMLSSSSGEEFLESSESDSSGSSESWESDSRSGPGDSMQSTRKNSAEMMYKSTSGAGSPRGKDGATVEKQRKGRKKSHKRRKERVKTGTAQKDVEYKRSKTESFALAIVRRTTRKSLLPIIIADEMNEGDYSEDREIDGKRRSSNPGAPRLLDLISSSLTFTEDKTAARGKKRITKRKTVAFTTSPVQQSTAVPPLSKAQKAKQSHKKKSKTVAPKKHKRRGKGRKTPSDSAGQSASNSVPASSSDSSDDGQIPITEISERSESSKLHGSSSDMSESEEVDSLADFHSLNQSAVKRGSIAPERRMSENFANLAGRDRKMTLTSEGAKETTRLVGKIEDNSSLRPRRASLAVDRPTAFKGYQGKSTFTKDIKRDGKTVPQGPSAAIEEEKGDDSLSISSLSEASADVRKVQKQTVKPPIPKPIVVIRRATRSSNTILPESSRNSVLIENPALDIFIKNFSWSLLYMITDIVELAQAGDAALLRDIGPGKKATRSLANAMKKTNKRSLSNKLAVPMPVRRNRRSMTESAASNAKQMMNRMKTLSRRQQQESVLIPPLSPVVSITSPSESDYDTDSALSSSEEDELETVRNHHTRMANYELRHLSMLKKMAIDLLKGSNSLHDDGDTKGRESGESADKEEQEKETLRPAREVRFTSIGEELTVDVQSALDAMFEGYRPTDLDAFMPPVSMSLRDKFPHEDDALPTTLEIDYESMRAALLRRRFRNQMELQPDYETFIGQQKGVFYQTDSGRPMPIELLWFLRSRYHRRVKRREVMRARDGRSPVELRALPSLSFTNLDMRSLTARLAAHRKGRRYPPAADSRPRSTAELEEERVYMRLKGSSDESFGKSPRGIDPNSLPRIVEELAGVALGNAL